MATVRLSIFPTARMDQITQAVGAATVTNNIELTVDLGNTMDGSSRVLRKQEVIDSVRRLLDFIIQGGTAGNGAWPPQ
ncbi:MAG: hypothetical protein QOI88_3365 [Gammaproteobacteria bacterium]|jgi:hypothetical protein|nr:hypothetical protein [Gammaproteobacteria bacterium]